MRVAVAGAGAVGQAIARALLADGHEVLLIERERPLYRPDLVPDADWMLGDACELATLQRAGIETCDVVMAATGDDKVNLVFAMLCKTEFTVPRVAARVNNPSNHWLFTEAWGVDVAVSTPGALVAAVEEAVNIGHLVRLMTLHQGEGSIVEVTLAPDSPLVGTRVGDLPLPVGTAMLTVLRDGVVVGAGADAVLAGGDEVVLAAAAGAEAGIRAALTARR